MPNKFIVWQIKRAIWVIYASNSVTNIGLTEATWKYDSCCTRQYHHRIKNLNLKLHGISP